MRSAVDRATRWCPVCESKGIPIVWGEPSESTMRLADEGRVIIGGCTPIGIHPSHGCAGCGSEFIASDRIYRRDVRDGHVIGIGVWPHGRRSVRIEDNDQGWTLVVAGEGSMLIGSAAAPVFSANVFEDMSVWQIADWARRRGVEVTVEPAPHGTWKMLIDDTFDVFWLTVGKLWWRSLGRGPVDKALERLGPHVVWLPETAVGSNT